jgi:hypothetical protein
MKRIDIIGQNGNDGLHYKEVTTMERLAQAVKAAKVFAAKNDLRYYLNGVALYITENKITSVVSSDGHCCAIIGSEDLRKADKTAIVDHKDLETLYNALLLSSDVTVNNTLSLMQIGDYQIPLVDGRYPDVARVIPKKERDAATLIGVQPNYLAKLKPFKLELCKHLTTKERNLQGTRMRAGGADESIIFEFSGEKIDSAIVLINPMRL